MDKVLIVDDDAQLLTIITDTLKKYKNKFELITAKDGLDAIKVMRKQPVSLVVTDLKMPIVNGLVLLAYMSKNFPTIPCIIMTGYGTPFLKKRLEEEALHYLEKPFKVTDLARAIISILGQEEILGGTLNGVSVAGFLKLVEMEHITCLCEISSSESKKGYLLFDGGVLCNAYYGNIRGEEAALILLKMDDVKIKFKKPPKEKVSRKIENELSDLLAEVVRAP
jgi:two-component system, chemotaxis family, protein-glutamate methylesterase/glutaminase